VRHQSRIDERTQETFKNGFENLAKHIEILAKYNLPTVAALNRFADDSDEDLRALGDFCSKLGVESAITEAFDKGGKGALELASKVINAAEKADLNVIKPLYSPAFAIEDKIGLIATDIYGACSVRFEPKASQKLEKFSDLGFGQLPVCMAKTQYSLSDDPKKLGAPKDWTLAVTDAHLASGAGFIVAVAAT
jgi:formate--tetrahydrofolate ligase